MNAGADGRHCWFRRIRVLTGRRRVVAYLFVDVLLAVGGLTAAVAGRAAVGGSVAAVAGTVMLLIAARAWPGLRPGNRVAGSDLQPSGPPIEQLASDLRRLLWRHEELSRSSDPSQVKWIKALEAAITCPAISAARALDLPYEDPGPYCGLNTAELRRLLRALTAEGLALPGEVGLLAPGGPY